MKAIILAGGLGTRLRSAVPNLPKPMAPVAGRPFLTFLVAHLVKQGVSEITLSVGYRQEAISNYFGDKYHDVPLRYVIEEFPLGTGGALSIALQNYTFEEPISVFNGDTFFNLDLPAMYKGYIESGAEVGIALKVVADVSRYGRVVLTNSGSGIHEFAEKGDSTPGLINGGVYLLRPGFFNRFDFPNKFSLEQDCFVANLHEIKFFPYITDGYFIDIGIPEDFERAQSEFKVLL